MRIDQQIFPKNFFPAPQEPSSCTACFNCAGNTTKIYLLTIDTIINNNVKGFLFITDTFFLRGGPRVKHVPFSRIQHNTLFLSFECPIDAIKMGWNISSIFQYTKIIYLFRKFLFSKLFFSGFLLLLLKLF